MAEFLYGDLSKEVIAAATEVHNFLGRGMLESAYEECLCRELQLRNIKVQRQVPIPVVYKDIKLECGYRIDLLIEDKIILELKAVDALNPVHEA